MKSFVSTSEVNELCEALVLDYVKGNSKSFCVDIEGFITEYLKLNIVYAPFAEDDLTKEGFLSDGIQPVRIYRNGRKEDHVFPKYTIVLDQYLRVKRKAVGDDLHWRTKPDIIFYAGIIPNKPFRVTDELLMLRENTRNEKSRRCFR